MDVVQLREEGVRQGREEGDEPDQGYDLKEHISKWYLSSIVGQGQGYDLKAKVVAGILPPTLTALENPAMAYW